MGDEDMNHSQFTGKFNGKFIDYDNAYGFQCVDLMRKYVLDVYGLKPYVAIPTTGNAKNIFYNFRDNKYFKKVLNTPNNMPKKGDIVFFKTSVLPPWFYGFAGHVAVVDSANVMSMILFGQNYPTGSACSFRKFSYKDCLGWLSRV
jgi:surface antigen